MTGVITAVFPPAYMAHQKNTEEPSIVWVRGIQRPGLKPQLSPLPAPDFPKLQLPYS